MDMQQENTDLPPEAWQHLDRAYTFEERGEFDKALTESDLTLQLAPDCAEAHNLRGILLEKLNQKQEAIAAYRAAVRLDPTFEEARENLLEAEIEARVEAKELNLHQNHLVAERLKIENLVKGGASGFFWVAGFSLINSIVLLIGGSWNFLIGLGITQFVDGLSMAIASEMGSNAGTILRIIAFAVDVGIAGIFVIFGVLARKKYKWAFIIGMILYALDGLIFLIVPDFWSIGFHLFLLFQLYGGLKSIDRLRQVERSPATAI